MQRHSQSPQPSSTKPIFRMVGGTVPRARCKKYHKKGDTLACTALFVIRWLQAAPSSVRIQCSTTVLACQGGSEKKDERMDCGRLYPPPSAAQHRGAAPDARPYKIIFCTQGIKKWRVASRKTTSDTRHFFCPRANCGSSSGRGSAPGRGAIIQNANFV